ncbi:MAG: hypothetical protein QM741_13680 [Rudaea sp.]|uniref:hypothetical protein n=1 Tax=Rudaea sp. TaxID=2136325 RepID=UPI0039E3C6E7
MAANPQKQHGPDAANAEAANFNTGANKYTALPKAIHGRPRGFIDWRPQAASRELVERIGAVLIEYKRFLPLTARQIFYRLVGTIDYEKTEAAYDRLLETLNRARRARMIPFSSIRDDGFHVADDVGWNNVDEARRAIIHTASKYRIDRQRGQPRRVVLWCEAQGMAPQLERVGNQYSIPVYSSGGFDSVTVKHNMAEKFSSWGNALVLHVGDHDPSGVHVFGSLDEDIRAFISDMGGSVEFRRVAVLPEHIAEYGLLTAPPKDTDRRNFHGETVQAEALPPDLLAALVTDAIKANINMDAFHQALDAELDERDQLKRWLTQDEDDNGGGEEGME